MENSLLTDTQPLSINVPDDNETITLLFDKQGDISESLISLMSETLGKGIVDSGSPETCSGDDWVNIYIESLSSHDRKVVVSEPAEAKFRFGAGPIVRSNRVVLLPSTFRQSGLYLGYMWFPSIYPFWFQGSRALQK